jgi:NADH-quinone oxidoreductase subunit E
MEKQGELLPKNIRLLNAIIKNYDSKKEFLICILQDVQNVFEYLPKQALIHISEKLKIPLIQIYGVATFFKTFSLMPRGGHTCTVCLGTACHVRGAEKVLDKIKRNLDIDVNETTKDMQFTLKTVNCLGACALGPMVVVDDDYHGHMSQSKVDEVLNKYSSKIKGQG